jgi:hypothetical protein
MTPSEFKKLSMAEQADAWSTLSDSERKSIQPSQSRTSNALSFVNGELLCTTCGSIGSPKKVIKGSFIVELLLWLFMILPGAIYTVYRLSTKKSVCSKCGNHNLIPLDSPIAKKFLNDQNK